MFAVLSGVAGVGLGWLTALAGLVKIINWLTIPTATANLIHAIGGLFFTVNFYGVLQVTRLVGIVIIVISMALPVASARRPEPSDRDRLGHALPGVVRAGRAAAVLRWPLAVVRRLPSHDRRSAIAASPTDMVIFKPDGAHGMYSWLHVLIATTCAVSPVLAVTTGPAAGPRRTSLT